MPKNRDLAPGSPQLDKINKEFKEAVATYKKILLYNLRCTANSFGNIPQQLSLEDFKKFSHLYGDRYMAHTDCSQDVIQLTRFDHRYQFFDPKTNDDDKELDFLNHYYAVQRSAFGIALGSYVSGLDDAAQILTNGIESTFTDHPTFFPPKLNEKFIKDLDDAMNLLFRVVILKEDPHVGKNDQRYIDAKATFDAFKANITVKDVPQNLLVQAHH